MRPYQPSPPTRLPETNPPHPVIPAKKAGIQKSPAIPFVVSLSNHPHRHSRETCPERSRRSGNPHPHPKPTSPPRNQPPPPPRHSGEGRNPETLAPNQHPHAPTVIPAKAGIHIPACNHHSHPQPVIPAKAGIQEPPANPFVVSLSNHPNTDKHPLDNQPPIM